MTDLREIGEWVNIDMGVDTEHNICDKHITTLLGALVEERARFNYVMAVIDKKELPDPDKYWHKLDRSFMSYNEDIIIDVKECWTRLKEEYKNDYRAYALRELNLKDVWPGKKE